MRLRKEPSIQVKSPEQIERMYAAGQVVARTLTVLKEAVAPGISTAGTLSLSARSAALGRCRRSLATSGTPRASAPR